MKKIFTQISFVMAACLYSGNTLAQTQLWGVTSAGGQYGAGTIFTTDGSGENQVAQYSFYQGEGSKPGYTKLTQTPDAMLYGMTKEGGAYGVGVLFQFNPSTSTYTKKIDFEYAIGNTPTGSLMLASDGMLYGLTTTGGANGGGVLFQFNPATSAYTKKADFDFSTTGSSPSGSLIEAMDGMFYGMTNNGGTSNFGTLFRFNPSNSTLTKLFEFDGTANGSRPEGSLVKAQDGMLYGMARQGGSNNFGVLFQYDPVNETYSKKMDFIGASNGNSPYGSLVQALDGKLYGMTQLGGANNFGSLFQYDPATSTYLKKYDFAPIANGARPLSSLMLATDGMLYGMTRQGGANGLGTIFQYDPTTSTYLKKFDFSTINGSAPNGDLMQASDGMLYGLTGLGGAGSSGTLFKYDPIGSTFAKVHDFKMLGIDGAIPYSSLLRASDGKFYGMTNKGGLANLGVLFQYDPATATYTKKFDFDGAANGSYPYGSLMQAPDGMLYGMAAEGGLNNKGVLFQYDPATSTFTKKFDFSTANGRTPLSALILGADGMLYGTAIQDGTNGKGVLFQYNTTTSTYTKKYDFDGLNGDYPIGLVQALDGMLYGVTAQGGSNGKGVLFQFDPATSIYTKKFDFDGSANGSSLPYGLLTQASDGMIYGVTSRGGLSDAGTIFQYNPASSSLSKEYDFNVTDGSQPYCSLLEASNGMLYGMTTNGGGNDLGVLFQFDPATSTFIKKYNFSDINGFGTNGATPYLSSLIEVAVTNSISAPVSPANICTGNSMDVIFTAAGAFNRGNVFTAQLSDATGSFASPVNIGSITSIKAGTINTTIPQLTPGGSGYQVRVISNNPAIIGVAGFAITVNAGPSAPGVITGDVTVCPLSTNNTYSIVSVSDAIFYTWTLPGGWSGTSTTNSIIVDAGMAGGNITVTTNNNICSSNPQILPVAITSIPDQPGTISGTSTICSGTLNIYSITAVNGATSYTWALPEGWTGTSTTNSIDATAGTTSGDVTVTANNTCGSSTAQTLAITVNSIPAQPGTISGTSTICSGTLNTYSVTAVSGATSYTWTLPGGWTGASTTNSIDATASATSGDVTVTANNTCGSSTTQTLAITINSIPVQPGTISGTSTICSGTLNSYTITAVSGATSYMWTLPGGWTGTSTTNSIDATASATSGDILVTANNTCGSSTAQTLAITVTSIPAQPGTISGVSTICSGTLNTYSITAVSGATSYMWTLPGGWTGTSTTNSIDATASATSGNISVSANNACGPSTSRTMIVTIPSQAKPTIAVNSSNIAAPILTSSADSGNQWFLNGNTIAGATGKTHTVSAKGSYQVRTTIDQCVSELSEAVVFLVTGDLQQQTKVNRVVVYPNPVESRLFIKLDGFTREREVLVRLVDGFGRTMGEILGEGEKEIRVEVGHYAAGIYTIQMTQGNDGQQIRFMKK